MTFTTIISITILSILYMFFKELEEESHHSAFRGKYAKWLNNRTSWINKWAIDKDGRPIKYTKKWYHFGVKHRYKERFPYSSTVLVGFTDGEHFFQLMQLICIFGIISIYSISGAFAFIAGVGILGFLKETILKKIIT
jgi:hypothetical protein